MKQNTLKRSRILVTAYVFCLLYILISYLSASVFDQLFCRVPAWLASLYLGGTCDGTTLALRSGHTLMVTRACGGSDFFILVCSMIAWYAMRPQNARNSTDNIKATQTSNIEHPTLNIQCSNLNKAIRQSRNKAIFIVIRKVFILFFIAWAFVNGVNSMRVVLSVWTRYVSEALLPERFDAAVHMVSGVMIFFPALLFVWWVCKTKTCEVSNERKN
jgi:hypothetical protein